MPSRDSIVTAERRSSVRVLAVGAIALLTSVAGAVPTLANESADPVEQATTAWSSTITVVKPCAGIPSIEFEPLNGRSGEYRTRTATVVLDQDLTAGETPGVLLHEIAHHAMISCGAYKDDNLRQSFNIAQGLPADRAWFDYSAGWGGTPAEHWAEALATLVPGSQARLTVSSDTIAVVRAWLSGSPLPTPAAATKAQSAEAPTVATPEQPQPVVQVSNKPAPKTVHTAASSTSPESDTTLPDDTSRFTPGVLIAGRYQLN